MQDSAQGQQARGLTLQEEKEQLKMKLKEIGNRHKKAPKYKKQPHDILNDPKGKLHRLLSFIRYLI
jgi:hypothetical protein